MSRPVKVKWKETEDQLLAMYRAERDAKIKIRLQALWRVCAGESMTNIAHTLGISDRAVRNWLRWYRQGGVDLLRQRKQGGHGRQSKVTNVQLIELKEAIRQGSLQTNAEIRAWLEQRFSADYSDSGLYKLLQRFHIHKRKPYIKQHDVKKQDSSTSKKQ